MHIPSVVPRFGVIHKQDVQPGQPLVYEHLDNMVIIPKRALSKSTCFSQDEGRLREFHSVPVAAAFTMEGDPLPKKKSFQMPFFFIQGRETNYNVVSPESWQKIRIGRYLEKHPLAKYLPAKLLNFLAR